MAPDWRWIATAAEGILDRVESEPVSTDWRDRVFALANDLFHNIGMQLSVEKYQATEIHRGANLDSIDPAHGVWGGQVEPCFADDHAPAS